MREVRADAPGRVNLIGEHTDYHHGYVLPIAVPQRTHVTLVTRADNRVRATSHDIQPATIEYELGAESRRGDWADYVQGLTWELRTQGITVGGFDLVVRSNVPVGSGLSSSAALEVAVLRAIRSAFSIAVDDVAMARMAQRAEVEFVGAPVGIMDQMAASLAGEQEALFLDTMTLDYERIALPRGLELAVIDSGVAHRHVSGGYATRRRESEEAARLLGVERLRHVAAGDMARVEGLPPLLARRARHVISENDRVLRARDALRAGDLATLGALVNASHASLRDDYEVSAPEVDVLVAMAVSEPQVFGARMTGGGFGGAVVIAAEAGAGRAVAERVSRAYRERTSLSSAILLP